MLAAKDVIKTPFIVINADDYYGKEGFKAVHDYLVNGGKSCMAGFWCVVEIGLREEKAMFRASKWIFGAVFERENMLSVSARKYEEENYEHNITYHGRWNRQSFRNRAPFQTTMGSNAVMVVENFNSGICYLYINFLFDVFIRN